jgi:hypothetical protein
MVDYAVFESWLGAPYVWWKPGDAVVDVDEPFWTHDGPLPSPEELRRKGCNCAGFLNLVRRSVGLSGIGGTGEWWAAVEPEPFDASKTYPVGTLYLANYVSPTDQGHLMLQGPNGVLHSIPDGGLVCQKVPDWEWFGMSAQVPPEKWIVPLLPGEASMLDYTFLYALEGGIYGDPQAPWFNSESPYWTRDLPLVHPDIVKTTGCNNAGLGNLARRSVGLCAIGRMSSWWGAYSLFGELYNPGTLYPMGTLLLRAYRGEDDPGHLGILTPRGVLHSTPEHGVVLEPETDLWEMAVLPQDWLTSS